MRIFNMSAAGIVAGALLFSFGGSVSAQDLFEADPIDLQFEREVRSTYIVRLSSSLPAQAVNNRANEIAARFGGRVRSVYTYTINGFAINMSSVALANMVRASGLDIVSVTRDQIVTIAGKTDNPGVAAPPEGRGPKDKEEDPPTEGTCGEIVPWGVLRVTGIDRADYDASNSEESCLVSDDNYSTTAVPDYSVKLTTSTTTAPAVCVIDTGVQPNHPDIYVIESWFAPALSREGENDLSGHGTHVAGTIGAIANGEGVVGVAPNARIISVKVLNRRGVGSWTSVLDGLEWIASKTFPDGSPVCAVANMSLGGPADSTTSPVVGAVRCLAAPISLSNPPISCTGFNSVPLGIKFTLAAGNSYKDASTYVPAMSSLGDYISGDASNPYDSPVKRSKNIHTIAAMDDNDDWAAWSNYGDPVSYIEPGVDIESTWKNDGYKTISGTSMAAPHMAGLLLRKLVNGGSLKFEGGLVTRNDIYGDPVVGDTYDLAKD